MLTSRVRVFAEKNKRERDGLPERTEGGIVKSLEPRLMVTDDVSRSGIIACDGRSRSALTHVPQWSRAIMTANSDSNSAKISHYEKRRSNKPLMEKRRRARINHSLSVLKGLIVKDEIANSQSAGSQSRLEKADILELAVMHVRTLEKEKEEHQRRVEPNANGDCQQTSDVRSFKLGYQSCCQDVSRLLSDPDVTKERVLDYLNEQKRKLFGADMSETDVTQLPDANLSLVYSPAWSGAEACAANATALASSYRFNPVPATPPSSPAQQVAVPGGVWRPWF